MYSTAQSPSEEAALKKDLPNFVLTEFWGVRRRPSLACLCDRRIWV
jgi:hypothetical protein